MNVQEDSNILINGEELETVWESAGAHLPMRESGEGEGMEYGLGHSGRGRVWGVRGRGFSHTTTGARTIGILVYPQHLRQCPA